MKKSQKEEYIRLMYQKTSVLVSEFPDLQERKIEAMSKVGIKKGSSYNSILNDEDKGLMKEIVDFLQAEMASAFSILIVFEHQMYNALALAMAPPKTLDGLKLDGLQEIQALKILLEMEIKKRDLLDNADEYRKKITMLRMEIYGEGDHAERLKKFNVNLSAESLITG